jgi:alpha-amylase
MGGVPGARGALAVVVNIAGQGVRSINMDTGRVNRRFYHLATIRHTGSYAADGFLIVRSAYNAHGDKSQALYTRPDGRADFLADSGCVTLWLEDGVGLSSRPRSSAERHRSSQRRAAVGAILARCACDSVFG